MVGDELPMNPKGRKAIPVRARILGLAVATLLVGAVVVYGASADDAPTGPASTVPTLRVVPASLAQQYGVFRRATDASDSLANKIAPDSDYVTQLGLNPALARRIATAADVPTDVWIAPTVDAACVFVQLRGAISPASTCGNATSDPYRSADSYTSRDGSTVDVVGLVRDGVESVTVVLADGTKMEVPVADNLYVAHLSGPPSTVQLTDPQQGTVTVPVAGYGPDAAPLR